MEKDQDDAECSSNTSKKKYLSDPLFTPEISVVHWEIIALNKCRKTVYSLSNNLDCLSDLNQVFATLNRIPFLINNDSPLKIK